MGSFLQLSRCTELGVRKSKFGFYETFGVGDALKPPCVFRIFGYLFPLAFEIYVTPNFIPFPLIPFQLGFHVGDHVLLSANAQSLRILPCGLTIFAHSPRRFFFNMELLICYSTLGLTINRERISPIPAFKAFVLWGFAWPAEEHHLR